VALFGAPEWQSGSMKASQWLAVIAFGHMNPAIQYASVLIFRRPQPG
jgi:hypothetical protein